MSDKAPESAVLVDPKTGEMVDGGKPPSPFVPAVIQPLADPFYGISTVEIRKEEAEMLLCEFPPEKIDILPTGEAYLTQVEYRRLLNAVFGPGAWGLRRMTAPEEIDGTIMVMYALVVRGAVVAEAPGESDYQPSNPRQSKATAIESAKSNALMRCCKDLGIASQCWDKRWAEAFKDEFCIMVRCQDVRKPQWRRKDSKPFWNEIGPWDAQGSRQSHDQGQARTRQPPKDSVAPEGSNAVADPRAKALAEVLELVSRYAKQAKITLDEAVAEMSGFTPEGGQRREISSLAELRSPKATLKWLYFTKRQGEKLLAPPKADAELDAIGFDADSREE